MEYSPNLTARYLAGKVDEYVKFQGRDTLTSNAARDDRARWARIPDGKACDFCNMLGSRGFVYRSAEKAGEHNDYHPHCNCQVAVCFEPDMQYYVKNGVRVPRGYDPDDPEHTMLIDDLYAEYVAAGKRYTSSSTYRRYERTRLPAEDFDAAMRRLSEARTPEELRRVGREIVDQWPGGAANADRAQWDELSRHARGLERQLENAGNVSGLSAAIDPELKGWAKQFSNEELWVTRKDGELFYKEGTPTDVSTTDVEDASFRDGRAKHTHTTPIGGTFGEDDVWYTAKTWLSEHEVEDTYNKSSYQLQRNQAATEQSAEQFALAYEAFSYSTYDELLGQIYDANGGDEKHGNGPTLDEKIEAERRLKLLQHEWLMNNAGRYGYSYCQLW